MYVFSKFEGTGNDFILIKDLDKTFPVNSSREIARLCHRRLGIGADGLILVQSSSIADYKMRIFNCDGNEASMCGNGLRSLIAYLEICLQCPPRVWTIESLVGVHTCLRKEGIVQVSLGCPQIHKLDATVNGVKYHLINTGVPHAVIFTDDLQDPFFIEKSQQLRHHVSLAPEGVNVNFVQERYGKFHIRTYERGVEGETLACGTGGAAVAIAAYCIKPSVQKDFKIVFSSGEELLCNLEVEHEKIVDITIAGNVRHVFDGQLMCSSLLY